MTQMAWFKGPGFILKTSLLEMDGGVMIHFVQVEKVRKWVL
jgi:hypothetical protein